MRNSEITSAVFSLSMLIVVAVIGGCTRGIEDRGADPRGSVAGASTSREPISRPVSQAAAEKAKGRDAHSPHSSGGEKQIAGAHGDIGGVNADEALKRLMDGNARFVALKQQHPNLHIDRRLALRQKQEPFAIILGCADSRVSAELVFDAGLGDLFVCRVAGNVADDAVLGSIEYAVEHLGSNLIMVLGHARCGAVAAAVNVVEKDIALSGHVNSLIEAIEPAVHAVKGEGGDLVDAAVRENVRRVVARLRRTRPILHKAVESGRVKVVGARYDLDNGRIELIEVAESSMKPAGAELIRSTAR